MKFDDDIEQLKELAIKAIEAAKHVQETSVPCTGWFNWVQDPNETVERAQFDRKATPEIILKLIAMLDAADVCGGPCHNNEEGVVPLPNTGDNHDTNRRHHT